MRTFRGTAVRNLLLTTTILGGLSTPSVTLAQTAADTNSTTPTLASETSRPDDSRAEIVVTGSRIRRDNFKTPSEVNIIIKDEQSLNGARDIASTLQSATVTSGASQINSSFLGFLSENGAAANTVGLRGLGSSRTLILLNGRRLAPAGVGPQLVSADLNVLPDAIVDRIEVLREGASSVYGSDAVAGVINIITDTKLNGFTLDGYDNAPTRTGGAGNSMRMSLAAGKVFDRGHITASFEYKHEAGLKLSDRSAFSCPRDLLYNPTTGAEVGAPDPATGKLSCFPYSLGSGSGIASGYGIAQNFTTGALNRLSYNGDNSSFRTVNGLTRVSPSPTQLQDTVISPIQTFTGYVNGGYDIGILGDAEIYGEGLFTRRESHQQNSQQFSVTQTALSPNIEIYGGTYAGTPIQDVGHYPNSPFFPNSVAAAGYNYFTPFIIPRRLQQNSQRVDFIRANGGLRGNLPFGDWHYDANFQYARSNGHATSTQITADRLSNALQTTLAPAGTPENLITRAIPGEFGAGNAYTCASNVANGAIIAGSTCAPFDIYNPAAVLNGIIPANVYNYLYRPETDHTIYRETIASLNLDGSLFQLPAGTVKLAVGYEHRSDYLNDTPPLASRNGQLYNYSNSGITRGSDQVDEGYGELNIPLFRDQPWAQFAELSASGRYTHYRSYGSDFTYHINAQYAVNDIVRFRGNYGTSFRAPNLYEQYVASQQGFLGSGVDPCSGFGTSAGAGTTLYKNCLAALSPILGNSGALSYISTQGPAIFTEGGAGKLKAEKSTTWGGGVILTAPRDRVNLSLAIDYFNLTVDGEIQQLGSTILTRCYQATDFGPNNPYCSLIAARSGAGTAHPGGLTTFQNPYLNVASQKASGVDFDLQYGTHISGGKFNLRVQGTRNIHQKYQPFVTEPSTDYNGTLGQQGAGAGPKWLSSLDADWTDKSDTVTFHYGLKYVGPQDSTDLIGPYVAGLGLGAVNTIYRVGNYFEHAISVRFKVQKAGSFTVGVQNLTNSHPPVVSQTPTTNGLYTRIGNYFNSSNYDYYGRSVFVHFTHHFGG
ncbi:TonB-dependent receptor domain-containing protein [Sphingomonas sp. MMS24-J13]|uniref:TonB-dependent receptor domain-containing protein n=1 Tax=Sphingomonas sp. MMS24-J13 TaxID=3238686 RepID=UPI00384AB53F